MYNKNYYQGARLDVFRFIKENNIIIKNKNILELGAGQGGFLNQINKYNPKNIDAIELMEINRKSLKKICTKVIIGNIDKIKYSINNYDLIIALDTIEHLKDPYKLFKKLENEMKPSSKIIISLPNNSHWSVLLPLVFKDEINYNPKGGLLDYSHYHLFTHKTIIHIIKQHPKLKIIKHKRKIPGINKYLNILTGTLFKRFFTFQNFYIIQKK